MIRHAHWVALLFVLGACAAGTDLKGGHRSGPFKNRKQHGLWTYSYENGNVQAKGNYNQDRQVGRWSYWYPEGSKEWDIGFTAEQFDGPAQWFWPNGNTQAYGAFANGLEVGPFSYSNEDGALVKEGEFDDGLCALSWMAWYDDAKPKARGMMWKNQRVGLWEFWGEDGTEYAHTFPTPPGLTAHREEWDDGVPRREGFLINGKPTGRWSTRHENGVRRASGRIVDGKPHGNWTLYRPDRTLLATVKFDHGEPVRDFQYYQGTKSITVPAASLHLRDDVEGFAKAEDAGQQPPGAVVSTWISEAISPLSKDAEYEAGDAKEPPAALLAELSRKSTLPLKSQPWTESEEENMSFLVQLYTDGAPNVTTAPGGGQYGGGPRGARGAKPAVKKAGEGDVVRSSPLIGRKLGFARAGTRDGGTIDLHTLEGKPLVLVILRGMSGEICVYCYTQVRALCKTMPEFKSEGANVVVVYPGDAERLEVFWKELAKSEELEGREAPFTFAYDPDFELVKTLSLEGNLALPATLVFDSSGTIRFAYVGADSADRPDAKRLVEKVRELKIP